ncbi:AMP-binding protein [Dactylosporangium darangshiense]|uniref:Carrier domain-containing protein n=1 Tax=Dactylosporangium darangshiense TaxID=579108 RepID=A0ABP8DQ75_9ACTN
MADRTRPVSRSTGTGVTQLLAAAAAERPDAAAVVAGDTTIDRGTLDERANQLAHLLRARGVRGESVVGVCLPTGVDLVVAVLAVWKAGGACLPLDPGHPGRRRQALIRSANASVVIGAAPGPGIISPDDPALAAAPKHAVDAHRPGEQLAAVIPVSGSVLVEVSDDALRHRLAAVRAAGLAGAGDRVLRIGSPALETALWELVWPLALGACVVLAAPARHADIDRLTSLIEEQRVTVAQCVPSWFHQFVGHEWVVPMRHLRLVVCHGDAPALDDVVRFHARHATAAVVAGLGPAETSGPMAYQRYRRPGGQEYPRPAGQTRWHVLDPLLRPVPEGAEGELYVAGPLLARGYRDAAALTAQRFVADPAAADGGRLYRTGDRVRRRPDGLEYLGPIRERATVQGFRIDLAEIERALTEHPAVATAVVTADAEPGSGRLIAYISTDPADDPLPPDRVLRAHLRQTLPDHLLPSAFVAAGGGSRQPNRPEPYVAARTPDEALLAGIWAEVLAVPRVGVTDNYLDLGGDSIRAIQVAARARRAGFDVRAAQVLQYQSVAELARACARRPDPAEEAAFPLTPLQLAFDRGGSRPASRSLLLKIGRPVDAEVLEAALAALVQVHAALRLAADTQPGRQRYAPIPPGWRCLVTLDGAPRLQVVAEATAAHADVGTATGPRLRAVLFDADDTRWLLLVAHRFAVDPASWTILCEDLETAYEQAERGEPIRLTGATATVGRWARALSDLGRSADISAEADFWRSPAGSVAIPRDDPAAANDLSATRTLHRRLTAEQTGRLRHAVPAAYRTTTAEALLAPLIQVIGDWAGGPAVTVDLRGPGRAGVAGVDVSRTLGWFTTAFPVTVPYNGPSEPGAVLRRTKERVRQTPRDGLGYGLLREYTGALDELPPAEVCLTYDSEPGPDPTGARFRPAPAPGDLDPAPAGPRAHLLELTCRETAGVLHMAWTYCTHVHRPATVERLAQRYATALEELIEHCSRPGAGGHTPSDFPLARLDQSALDLVQRRVGRIFGGQS